MFRKLKQNDETEHVVSAENILHEQVIKTYIKDNPGWILFAREYDVIPLMSGFGRGDLVFFNRELNKFHIVECKNHSHNKTINQSEYYASWIKVKYPNSHVTYQAVVNVRNNITWSIINDIDLKTAIVNTLTKINELKGLNHNELNSLGQLYTNLYTVR